MTVNCSSDSILTLTAEACFMLALPKRIVLRLPSLAIKRIRLSPFPSLLMLAMIYLAFLFFLCSRG